MKIIRGKDGKYCASQTGDMGRAMAASGNTRNEAVSELLVMICEQRAECYAHEQSMSHLADVTYGEGAYGEDMG